MVTKEFNSQQIYAAKELRTMSQAKLLELLERERKLAFNFNNVTKVTMLEINTYNELIDRLEKLEAEVESLEMEQRYGNRRDPDEAPGQWTSKPEGTSLAEWYTRQQGKSR
ncbi:hypothetical protein [Alkalicoccus urumqiensis]|uniref:Uncharacterized protein n=1 Tax=Alkalicoccus urumqiensis TaxID=1548213 RepID=A0A2P6MJM8_ALKUR|nr:hypothetical protein [Alkalicoccus urumqiensis]PRO66492.1 hypothetical protein C6I21_03890 [Alkalicoccus urumqiensis]